MPIGMLEWRPLNATAYTQFSCNTVTAISSFLLSVSSSRPYYGGIFAIPITVQNRAAINRTDFGWWLGVVVSGVGLINEVNRH